MERHRVVPGGAQRMAADQPAGGEPDAVDEAMTSDGDGRVVRAGRQEPARSAKIRRDGELVAAEDGKRDADAKGVLIAADAYHARRDLDIRFQEGSGWRRAGRGWGSRRRRTPRRSCCDGKPLVSIVWRDFFERRHLVFSSPRCPVAQSRPCWAGRMSCCSGPEAERPARTRSEILRDGGSARSTTASRKAQVST